MAFAPVIDRPPAPMDPRIFRDEPMGLRDDLLRLPLARRFAYDAARNTLFINFEGLTVRAPADVDAIREQVLARVAPLGQRVFAVVNYDNFRLLPDAEDAYYDMVRDLVQHHYRNVTRYSGSNFLRMKLGDALRERGLAPHIFESADEARRGLARHSDT